MLNNNFISGLIILMYLFAIVAFPFAVIGIKKDITSIYHSSGYNKLRIKVDSLSTSTAHSTKGRSLTDYTIYNFQYSIEIKLSDENGIVFKGRDGKEGLVSHMLEHMNAHRDSIWIWYHPEASPKYAKDDDVNFPLSYTIESFLWKFLAIVFVLSGIIYVMYKIKKKPGNQ